MDFGDFTFKLQNNSECSACTNWGGRNRLIRSLENDFIKMGIICVLKLPRKVTIFQNILEPSRTFEILKTEIDTRTGEYSNRQWNIYPYNKCVDRVEPLVEFIWWDNHALAVVGSNPVPTICYYNFFFFIENESYGDRTR